MTRGQRGWLTLRCQRLALFHPVPVCPGTPERIKLSGGRAKLPPTFDRTTNVQTATLHARPLQWVVRCKDLFTLAKGRNY